MSTKPAVVVKDRSAYPPCQIITLETPEEATQLALTLRYNAWKEGNRWLQTHVVTVEHWTHADHIALQENFP